MDDNFEIPDLGDLTSQIEDAMKEAQKAMDDIPDISGLGDIMGSLSSLVENMPDQMADLSGEISGFEEAHAANAASLIGDPDWGLEADIKVGSVLHVKVSAEFDLSRLKDTWKSTQGSEFEDIVSGVVGDTDMDLEDGVFGQIMGQLKQGRGAARVTNIELIACNIQGAPGNAVDILKLSPEGNIPLVLNETGIGFEFAPMLTIRNQWENAAIPTFLPMVEEIILPISSIDEQVGSEFRFTPGNQEKKMEIGLRFKSLS